MKEKMLQIENCYEIFRKKVFFTIFQSTSDYASAFKFSKKVMTPYQLKSFSNFFI